MVRSIESRAEGKKDAPKAEIPKRVNSTTSKTVQQTTEKASNSARSEKQPEVPEKTNSTTQMTLPTTPEVTKAKEADNSFDSPDMNKLRPKDPLTPDSSSHDYENGVVHVLPPSGGALKRFPYKEGTHNLSNFTLIVKSITEEEWEKSKEAKLKNKLRKLFTGEKEMDDSKIVINQRPQREEAAGPQSEESKKENSANNSLNSPDNASPKNKKNIRKNNDKSPALQMQSTPGKSMATKKPIKFAKPYYFEVVTVPRNERMEAAVSAESLKEFISKIRSRVVILPSNNITDQKLQGLLAGKQTWCHNDHPCTVVPTHSSEALTDFLLQNGNQFSTNHLSFTVPVENQKATPSGYKFVKVPLD
uniref:DNA-binding protein n=1 Tax=Caenorhabditis tropicalis TaxID=1561998 RepID=A0A1I7USW3_9PELO